MKKINVETLVPNTFKFLARDMDGKLYAFENEPNLATDIACDTWDVKEGKILKITSSLTHQTSIELLDAELGDWRESLTKINEITL